MKTKAKRGQSIKPDVLIENLDVIREMRITVRGKEIFNGSCDDVDVWTLMDVINSLGHTVKMITPEKQEGKSLARESE